MSIAEAVGGDAHRWRAAVLRGEMSVRDGVEHVLARVDAENGALNAFLSVEGERALQRADELDAELARGVTPGLLFGLPVALKANLCRRDSEVNCGSRILEGYRAPYSATCVERLEAAGAIPIGAANMDEFAMGSSGENSAFGPTRNPRDASCFARGSSSGSAAAVAAGFVPLALGSDTGGSVRQPAAFTGTVGFKPTYGRVSRYGLVAFGSSLDQVSPLARSVRDVELVLAAIAGEDARDSTTLPEPAPLPELGDDQRDLEGMRVGVAPELFPDELDDGVRAEVERALEHLRGMGCELVDVSLPDIDHAISTYYVVAAAEASSNLARYDGVRYGQRRGGDRSLQEMISASREAGFGDEVKRRILLGTFVLSSGYADAWYAKALRVRRLLRSRFDDAFQQVDLVAAPTAPTTAFPLGSKSDPLAMYRADILTVPASLAGLPALSVPCGTATSASGSELPVGLQFIGPALADARVLRAGRLYTESLDSGEAT